MQPFDELPRPVQLRRMGLLARSALGAFALGDAQLTPVQHFLNTTFRVDVLARKERIAAHIGKPAFGAKAAIRVAQQLEWLKDLFIEAAFRRGIILFGYELLLQ